MEDFPTFITGFQMGDFLASPHPLRQFASAASGLPVSGDADYPGRAAGLWLGRYSTVKSKESSVSAVSVTRTCHSCVSNVPLLYFTD